MAYIQKRDNKWVARYRTPAGKERSKSFTRRIDAQRYLDHIEVDKVRGTYVDPRLGKRRFKDWSDEFWATTAHLRNSSRARDESYLRNHILPTFGDLPLSAIDNLMIKAWVAELSTRKAPATVHKAHQILSKILRGAVDAGLITRNPAIGVKLPKNERSEMRCLTPSEVRHLTDHFDERFRTIIPVAAYSGLRIGELLALRRKDIDIVQRRITVCQTLTEVQGRLEFNPPKTSAGFRTVPLPKSVLLDLNEHIVTGRVHDPEALVFTSPQGGPVRLPAWRQRFWNPAVKSAGLAPLRIHDLRHTAVSFWIAVGASPKEIAVRAGHSSVVTVLDRYGHLLPSTEERVTDALDALHLGASQNDQRSAPVLHIVN